MVAWGLIDFHHIRAIWQTSKPEAAVLWVTIIGTLLNLEAGIVAGVLLSLLLYLNRTSKPGIEPMVPVEDSGGYHFIAARGKAECPQLRVVRINGSAYFGAVDHIQSALQQIDVDNPRQKSVLVVSLGMNFIDVAGAEMFAQEARRLSHSMYPMVIDVYGLSRGLPQLCAEFSTQSGVRCECQVEIGAHTPPADAPIHLYRITQEALASSAPTSLPVNVCH